MSVQDLVYCESQIPILRRHHPTLVMRVQLQPHVIVRIVNRRMVLMLLGQKRHARQKSEGLLEVCEPELPDQAIVALFPHARKIHKSAATALSFGNDFLSDDFPTP
jgi:hypothetical protein